MPNDLLQADFSQLVCKRLNQNQLPEPIPLSVKTWLLDDATYWLNGTEKMAGSRVFSRAAVSFHTSEPFFDVKHTLVKYKGVLFEYFNSQEQGKGLITQGGFGRIDVLRDIKTGWLYPVKLSYGIESVLREVEALEAMDLCKGWFERAVPATTNGFMGYQLQSQIVMPWLGQNLTSYMNHLNISETIAYEKRCFEIAIGMAYAVLELHWAISIVDLKEGVEEGFTHGDIKPDNMLIEEESTPQKVKLIDFGLSHKYVNRLVRDNQGTPPYALFTGQRVPASVLDVIGLKQSLQTVSYDNQEGKKSIRLGILTPTMIRSHHLYRFLKIDGHDLSHKGLAHDALSLTAILIAAETGVEFDVLIAIGRHPHLAALIICEYYTHPERSLEQRKELIVISALTAQTGVESLEIYTVLLKFGLANCADKALETPELLRVLDSFDESFTLKRAVARLFQCGRLGEDNMTLLRENPKLAVECIRLYHRKDWMALDALLDDTQTFVATQAFKVPEIPLLFSWESEAKLDFLRQQGNKRMLGWLSDKVKRYTAHMHSVDSAFREGVVLRVFLKDKMYQKAIYWVKSMLETSKVALFEEVLSALLQAHGKHLAQVVLAFKDKPESFWPTLGVISSKQFFKLIHAVYEESGILDDAKINKLPDLVKLKRLLFISSNKMEVNQTDTVLLCQYFLSEETLPFYFFERGDEADKRKFLLFCLQVLKQADISQQQVERIKFGLKRDVVVEAGVVLSQFQLLNVNNLLNIVSDDTLCRSIVLDEEWDELVTVRVEKIKEELIYASAQRIVKRMGVTLDGFDTKYMSLSRLITRVDDAFSSKKIEKALYAFVKIYQALATLEEAILSHPVLNQAIKAHTQLISDLNEDTLWFERLKTKALISERIKLILKEIKHFACCPHVVDVVKEMDKAKQFERRQGGTCGRGCFFSLHKKNTGVMACLKAIKEAVQEIEERLGLMTQSRSFLSWFNHSAQVQPVDRIHPVT
ncbi:MAG: hypothetical protein K0U37_07110 [Gammaproteobacteria bacterium]|nr:hypothetical protein [Gammaproteobacteria bacterium]